MHIQLRMCGFMPHCLSQDPFLSGMLARGLMKGLQVEGIAATIKHFVMDISLVLMDCN
jgi:beta-glucosidase-like glycosyl hydrolase